MTIPVIAALTVLGTFVFFGLVFVASTIACFGWEYAQSILEIRAIEKNFGTGK